MGLFTKNKEKVDIKKIIEPDIQVMMLGSRRVGKTSILASMKREFNEVTKETNLVLTSEGNVTSINDASENMMAYFAKAHNPLDEIKLDDNATASFVNYDLNIGIAGKRAVRPKKIRFLDCPGEWIRNADSKPEEMGEAIEKSSVIIIAIDSVLMMEQNGLYNRQNNMLNVTEFIKKHMIPGELVNGQKMVLFVPLKCEKYYYQDKDIDSKYYGKRMRELRDCVKDRYSELFAYLCNEENRKYFTVAIMPILTLGGIEFDHFVGTHGSVNEELTSDKLVYTYCGKGEDVYKPMFCEQPLMYSLLYEQKKISSDYYKNSFNNAGKKKMSAKLKEWFYEKRNLATDEEFNKELNELMKNYKKTDNSYVEIVQNAIF